MCGWNHSITRITLPGPGNGVDHNYLTLNGTRTPRILKSILQGFWYISDKWSVLSTKINARKCQVQPNYDIGTKFCCKPCRWHIKGDQCGKLRHSWTTQVRVNPLYKNLVCLLNKAGMWPRRVHLLKPLTDMTGAKAFVQNEQMNIAFKEMLSGQLVVL